MYHARNEAREELKREQLAAGLMSERFPEVASIVVKMNYSGGKTMTLRRTVNFLPISPAFFRISCLGDGCERGGLELTTVIGRMIRERERAAKGELRCVNRDPAVQHAEVEYEVAITYA